MYRKLEITGDGIYTLVGNAKTGSTVVYVSGTQGTAVLRLGYNSPSGFVALEQGVITTGSQNVVDHGVKASIVLKVESSDVTTDLYVEAYAY